MTVLAIVLLMITVCAFVAGTIICIFDDTILRFFHRRRKAGRSAMMPMKPSH